MKTHSGDRHLANDVTLLLLLGVIWGSLSWANQMFANDVILLLFLRIIWGSLSKHITLYLILNANREVTRSGGPTSLILTSWTLQLSRKGGCLNKILVFFVVWISLIIFILMAFFGKDRRSILCNPVHKIDARNSRLFRAPESFEGAACVQRETIWLDGENQLRFCQPILVGNVCCLHWLIYQIGDVGDFIHSDRYNEMKNRCSISFKIFNNLKLKNMISFGEELFRLCDGMVKQRTCHTNYAPLLAVLRFQFETFRFCLLLSNKDIT